MSGPEELRSLVEEMRATLEPLRRYYDLNDCDDRDDDDALEIPIADLRRARAALTRAESSLASPAGMEGWMPIETAPKDGTNIVARDGRLTFVCRWNIDRACWWALDCFHVFPKIWHLAPTAPRGESE